MWSGVTVVARPDGELISLAKLKRRLVVEHSDDDDLLADFLREAIARIDGPDGIGVAMMRQTWRKSMDEFPSCIVLPGAPVVGVKSIKYMDVDGMEQTLDASLYRVDVDSEPARVTPVQGACWPATPCAIGAVKVEYELGAETSDKVPADLVAAACLLTAHRYAHRGVVGESTALPFGVQWILESNSRCTIAA